MSVDSDGYLIYGIKLEKEKEKEYPWYKNNMDFKEYYLDIILNIKEEDYKDEDEYWKYRRKIWDKFIFNDFIAGDEAWGYETVIGLRSTERKTMNGWEEITIPTIDKNIDKEFKELFDKLGISDWYKEPSWILGSDYS